MKPKLDFLTTTPNVVKAMFGLHKPLSQSGLEKGLLDLVYFRVSQINGFRRLTRWQPTDYTDYKHSV